MTVFRTAATAADQRVTFSSSELQLCLLCGVQSKAAEILGADYAAETSWRGRVVTGDQSSQRANRDTSAAEGGVHASNPVDVVMIDWRCVIQPMSSPFPDALASRNIFLFTKERTLLHCHNRKQLSCCYYRVHHRMRGLWRTKNCTFLIFSHIKHFG